jgi:hypothetical protein
MSTLALVGMDRSIDINNAKNTIAPKSNRTEYLKRFFTMLGVGKPLAAQWDVD